MAHVWRSLVKRTFECIHEENGQGLVEYTLLVGLIALVAIASVTTLGETILTRLYTLGGSF